MAKFMRDGRGGRNLGAKRAHEAVGLDFEHPRFNSDFYQRSVEAKLRGIESRSISSLWMVTRDERVRANRERIGGQM